MKTLDHPISIIDHETLYAKWSRWAFFVYLFFIFFGTSMPFPDLTPDQDSPQTSNILNQLLSLLFFVSLITLLGKHDLVIAFIKREKFLTLFMVWALCSVLWSNYSLVSLKRWIGLFGEIIICLAALLHFRWSEVALRHFRAILLLYLPLTILSIIFIPEAIQWEFPAWRGLAATKNNLAQVALFSIILCLGIIPYNRNRAINIVHYGMLTLAFTAYLGARSTTAFMVGGALLLLLGTTHLGKRFKQGLVANFYTVVVIASILAITALVTIEAPEILESVFGLFGKDLSFTGRVDLWKMVFSMTEGNMLTGWGLGGFWVMDGAHLRPLFEEFVWIPNQAHQGYIDILNQVGIPGLTLLLLMIASYLTGLSKLKKNSLWKWLFLGVIILNFQESVFFRPRHISHFMFLFAYIALFTDLVKEEGGQNIGPVPGLVKQ